MSGDNADNSTTGYSSDTFGKSEWAQPPPCTEEPNAEILHPKEDNPTQSATFEATPPEREEHLNADPGPCVPLLKVNPFSSKPLSASDEGHLPTHPPDEADTATLTMDRLLMNNPTSISGSHKGNRPRYFQGMGGRGRGRRFQRERAPKRGIEEDFVTFVPAGENTETQEGDGEDNQDCNQLKILPTAKGYIKPVASKDFISTLNELVAKKGKKRAFDPFGENNEDAIKRMKITPERPATAILNEITPSMQFSYEDIRESMKAEPNFKCTATFPVSESGKEFFGHGRSKKLAKIDVSEKILQSLGFEIPSKDAVPSSMKMETDEVLSTHLNEQFFLGENQPIEPIMDFSSDDFGTSAPEFLTNNLMPTIDISSAKKLQNIQDFENNAVSALNTLLGPDSLTFEEVSEEGPAHDKTFCIKLQLKSTGQTFQGIDGSKKRAKVCAAKQALISLLGPNLYEHFVKSASKAANKVNARKYNQPEHTEPLLMSDIPKELFNEDSNTSEYDLTFSDYICRIVNEKYEELMAEHQDYISQKVLAGVVMTRQLPMLENGEVIAVTTGTKCVEGDFMSTDGLAINDCHAEILATRCVRDFLYSQLEYLVYSTSDAERDESVLEQVYPNTNSDDDEAIYKLKDNVKFHLYISTSPCGDARIFSPKGLENDDGKAIEELEDNHPSKRNRGVLRAKVEAGEGTIPVANLISGPQTFDSIVQGNALYTMSCSDKLCRLNVVGIQGALLSNLILPVYFSSIILGSLHHPIHFRRAVLGRIETLAGHIPPPFKINRSHLLMVSHEEKRKVKKSPNHAMCWALGWSTPEILAASKGRGEPGGIVSRLTKRMAFMRFLKLYKNKTGRREGFAVLSYREAKSLARDYQTANETFRYHMKGTNLGTWISKPVEVDSFHIIK